MTVSAPPLPFSLRVGLAGCGTVGGGVLRLLHKQANLIAARAGRAVQLVAVSALTCPPDLPEGVRWIPDAAALAADPNVDVVVEVIGGVDGIARRVVETALDGGKHVVTANKALLAHHGLSLARRAEAHHVALLWEAAVGGGIPIITGVRDGLSANGCTEIAGILNGTCNYILSTMAETGRDFADVLAEAQRLGYAEADPSTDIDGLDTAHKITLLSALAFGTVPDLAGVAVEGIRTVTAADIATARQEGYVLKLIACARLTPEGAHQWVRPCRVPLTHPFASVNGSFNAITIKADHAGDILWTGRGAGAEPTASAVVSDLITLARGIRPFPFGRESAHLCPVSALPLPPAGPGRAIWPSS